jgi:hypothetical protein
MESYSAYYILLISHTQNPQPDPVLGESEHYGLAPVNFLLLCSITWAAVTTSTGLAFAPENERADDVAGKQ